MIGFPQRPTVRSTCCSTSTGSQKHRTLPGLVNSTRDPPPRLNSFDIGRAITSAVASVVLGPDFLATLRRAARGVHISPR